MKETTTTATTMESSLKLKTKSTSTSKPLRVEIKENIRQVFNAQEDRVRLLNEFDAQFKTYLLDAPEFDLNSLKLLCKTTSEQMNEISMRILAIRNQFGAECFDLKSLYTLVDRLQDGEGRKFKLVLLP